jgi:hypothetical protein
MKVYLIKTPEYESDNFLDVCDLLSSFDGPLSFVGSEYEFRGIDFGFLDYAFPKYKSLGGVKKVLYDISMQDSLSWEQLFSLCKHYRNTFKINENDFVVLLTSRRNALNWFSYFEDRNAFVHTGDWEHYTDANPKYPIAYQVVENVMQSLMKLDVNIFPNTNMHTDARGCMNDFCQNKQQIILKLRTGDICKECLSKMRIEKIDEQIVNQACGIFEAIRNQLLFKIGFINNLNPKPVRIGINGEIFIGDKQIDLNPLESTLFIFFITRREGVSLNDLENYREQLLKIYLILRPAGEESKIDNLIKPKGTGTFPKHKSSLNKKLKEQIGEPLVNFYYIDGNRGEAFRINISPDFVTVDIRY